MRHFSTGSTGTAVGKDTGDVTTDIAGAAGMAIGLDNGMGIGVTVGVGLAVAVGSGCGLAAPFSSSCCRLSADCVLNFATSSDCVSTGAALGDGLGDVVKTGALLL